MNDICSNVTTLLSLSPNLIPDKGFTCCKPLFYLVSQFHAYASIHGPLLSTPRSDKHYQSRSVRRRGRKDIFT